MTASPVISRWLRFNGVGALGVVLQLSALGLLTRGAGLHYLAATAVAVELAVLHNFILHERWTWRDRPAGSAGRLVARLWRFHALNGAISLGGNLLVMAVLTGTLGLDPVVANLMAILLCSVLNFAASELLVFTRVTAALLVLLALPAIAHAGPAAADAELQPATVKAWTAYEQQVEARYTAAPASGTPFFALDAFGAGAWQAVTSRGEVFMWEAPRASPRAGEVEVPDGRIHHWAGAIFVPGASLDGVLARLASLAGREEAHYDDVVASRLLGKEGDRYRISMKLRRTKVITVTYNTEHTVEYRRLGPQRATARSVATRIAELEAAGTPAEREKPPGQDGGYLWRLNAYWRYAAVDGGVLVECESVSLSRSIPLVLRPFITGMVERVARDSLERTLASLRRVLTAG